MGHVRAYLLIVVLVACGHRSNGHLDGGGGRDGAAADAACAGLACFQFDCAPKNLPPTSISGTVYAPNGTLPLYGINVYVPASDPGPLAPGASCDKCSDGLPGGSLAATTTDEKGHFELDNVPATTSVPIVIQQGKWRRELSLPNVAACQDTPLDAADTTLPKSRTDMTPFTTSVNMPKIALSTGNADALECLLLKLGIAETEITTSAGSGQINLFTNTDATPTSGGAGSGASAFVAGWPGGSGSAFTDSQATLWDSTTTLMPYDIVILSCEGEQWPATKTQTAMQALHDYAGAGGRVFMSHWHNIWISGQQGTPGHGLADWETAATWSFNGNPSPDTLTATIDEVNNPKGPAFATWMLNVGGSTTRDLLIVTSARDTASGVNASTTERWVYLDPATSPAISSAMNFQFTVPMNVTPDQRCGKVVFSDMHVSADSTSFPTTPYPGGCSCMKVNGQTDPLCTEPNPMTPQEKALAFMLFDIASCVSPIE